ncbi:MAG: hypothetical protein AAGA60_10890 [Cyanobacteria bacterium P01_E01_bin.42]
MDNKTKLATFNVRADQWDEFKDLAKRNGLNASEVLREFVESYLKDGSIETSQCDRPQLERRINKIDRDLNGLTRRVEAMERINQECCIE